MNASRIFKSHTASITRALLVFGVTFAASGFAQAYAAMGEEPAEDGKVSGQQVQRHVGGSGIDRRIKLLTAELNLEVDQQTAVRRLLESQREQTLHIWSNDAVPAAVRVKSTQALSERTADQIRALLTEEQRKLYIQPRNDKVARNAERPDVEAWMRGGQPQLPQSAQ